MWWNIFVIGNTIKYSICQISETYIYFGRKIKLNLHSRGYFFELKILFIIMNCLCPNRRGPVAGRRLQCGMCDVQNSQLARAESLGGTSGGLSASVALVRGNKGGTRSCKATSVRLRFIRTAVPSHMTNVKKRKCTLNLLNHERGQSFIQSFNYFRQLSS